MILVDTSVWADHFRQADDRLAACLGQALVVAHPFVIGELALGHLHPRATILGMLDLLPRINRVDDAAFQAFVEAHALIGAGLGYVDAHLLAAARATGMRLWTRDRRLHQAAERLGVAHIA